MPNFPSGHCWDVSLEIGVQTRVETRSPSHLFWAAPLLLPREGSTEVKHAEGEELDRAANTPGLFLWLRLCRTCFRLAAAGLFLLTRLKR